MTRATVFGVDVWSDGPVHALQDARTSATGRSLDLTLDRYDMARREWPASSALIGRHVDPTGRTVFSVRSDSEEGWQLSADGHGEHWLSADGLRLLCKPDGAPPAAWQRFLIAQVLPFAAAVKGLETMHASAVVIDGGAVALLGRAGAGKTTLALALCELGATFLADDVVALEPAGELLLAHPGAPRAVVKRQGERMVSVPIARWPAPLASIVVLAREPSAPASPALHQVKAGHELLAGTFNLVLRDGERAARLLDVSARAARAQVLTLRAAPAADAAQLAEALIGHLRHRSG